MNDTTRELLLKTRKGATSSFGPKQWKEVLEALGFVVELGKERNSIVSFQVLTQAGGQLVAITKEPRYRCITFYRLTSSLKDLGHDLVELSSKALGLDTPDVEKALRELYVRDLTNTGTCPVCEGNFKRNGPGLVHHGYKRPGDGFIHGDCFAVGYLPWECSPQGAVDYVAQALRPHLEGAKAYLAKLQAGEITKFFKKVRTGGYGSPKTTVEVTRESDSYEFEQMLKSAIYSAERDVRWTEEEIVRFEARIANWKPDDLPEVKHAGKFKVA